MTWAVWVCAAWRNGDVGAYEEAFAFFDEGGCPGGCQGYELVNDLDLSSVPNWTPIGGGARDLSGDVPPAAILYNAMFEGNGHVISNMRVAGDSDPWDFVGLFRALGDGGVIRKRGSGGRGREGVRETAYKRARWRGIATAG